MLFVLTKTISIYPQDVRAENDNDLFPPHKYCAWKVSKGTDPPQQVLISLFLILCNQSLKLKNEKF